MTFNTVRQQLFSSIFVNSLHVFCYVIYHHIDAARQFSHRERFAKGQFNFKTPVQLAIQTIANDRNRTRTMVDAMGPAT